MSLNDSWTFEMEISKTDIRTIEHLLDQCSTYIEKKSLKTSPEQDLARRCKRMIKILNKKMQKYDAHMV